MTPPLNSQPSPLNDPSPLPLLVSAEDHLAGFKEVEVHFRAGGRELLRLHAPSRAQVRGLAQRFADAGDIGLLVDLCLPPRPGAPSIARPEGDQSRAMLGAPQPSASSTLPPFNPSTPAPSFMDRLTPASGDLVEATCFALAFGLEAEKKMSAFGASLTRSTSPAPSSGSSAADGPGPTSSAGAGPSSGSAPQ